MPTSGSVISCCIAAKATTIGKVAGAGSPSAYGVPVAAANSATRSAVTSYGAVGGNVLPARVAWTAMPGTLAAELAQSGDVPGRAQPVEQQPLLQEAHHRADEDLGERLDVG